MNTQGRFMQNVGGGSRGVSRVISLLIADDHPVVRFGVAGLLGEQPDFTVVGEAGSCRDLCQQVADLKPDVVLLDLEMSDSCGVEAVAQLRECQPDTRVVVFTAHDDEWYLFDAVKLGVHGYVMKGSSNESLFQAIRVVMSGGVYLDPMVASKITGRLMGNKPTAGSALTDRERAVLRQIAAGRRNKEIADELGISERTVKYHISSVLAKLEANNRTEAVKIAAARGLVRM